MPSVKKVYGEFKENSTLIGDIIDFHAECFQQDPNKETIPLRAIPLSFEDNGQMETYCKKALWEIKQYYHQRIKMIESFFGHAREQKETYKKAIDNDFNPEGYKKLSRAEENRFLANMFFSLHFNATILEKINRGEQYELLERLSKISREISTKKQKDIKPLIRLEFISFIDELQEKYEEELSKWKEERDEVYNKIDELAEKHELSFVEYEIYETVN